MAKRSIQFIPPQKSGQLTHLADRARLSLARYAFLGETFRRRFNGQWALDASTRRPRLGIVCPRSDQGLIFVDVMDQVSRRISHGMNESLAFYYTIKGVEIKSV